VSRTPKRLNKELKEPNYPYLTMCTSCDFACLTLVDGFAKSMSVVTRWVVEALTVLARDAPRVLIKSCSRADWERPEKVPLRAIEQSCKGRAVPFFAPLGGIEASRSEILEVSRGVQSSRLGQTLFAAGWAGKAD
jgi:hypothetical protein